MGARAQSRLLASDSLHTQLLRGKAKSPAVGCVCSHSLSWCEPGVLSTGLPWFFLLPMGLTCSSRSRTSRMIVPVSSMVWMSWLQFYGWQEQKACTPTTPHPGQPPWTLLHSPHARQLDTCMPSEQHHPSWHPDQTEGISGLPPCFPQIPPPGPHKATLSTPLIILCGTQPGWSSSIPTRLTQGLCPSQPVSRQTSSSPAPPHPSTQPSLTHTLNTSSSVTANVRSSFPDRELISF